MYTNIRITTPVVQNVPTNKFVITMYFQLGDADGSEMETLTVDESNHELLLRTYSTLRACIQHTPEAAGGSSYSNVPNWGELLSDYWAHDYIYDCQATLERITVHYFDSTGTKFNVEID